MVEMGDMDVALKNVVLSSLLPSKTPSGTSVITILIIVPFGVSLSVVTCGKPKRFPLVSCPLFSCFRIRDANFTHVFLAVIDNSLLKLTCRTINNTARN